MLNAFAIRFDVIENFEKILVFDQQQGLISQRKRHPAPLVGTPRCCQVQRRGKWRVKWSA